MVPAVVLAAGRSARMGRPKALLPVGDAGETFLSRIVGTLRSAGVDDVLVVVGHDAGAIADLVQSWPGPPRLVHNPRHEDGQLTSLLAALDVADRPGVRGLLVTLVDVPLVGIDTVRRVLDAWRGSAAPIVRPASGGRHGHPVLFDRRVFGELRGADPARGAKAVVHAHAADILELATDDEGAFADVDTPEDYERLIGPLPRQA